MPLGKVIFAQISGNIIMGEKNRKASALKRRTAHGETVIKSSTFQSIQYCKKSHYYFTFAKQWKMREIFQHVILLYDEKCE